MEESGSPWGKILPLLVFLAIAGIQAWLKARKRKEGDPEEGVETRRRPAPQAPTTRRGQEPTSSLRPERLSPRATEASTPSTSSFESSPAFHHRQSDFRLRTSQAGSPATVPVAPATEGFKRKRSGFKLGRKQLREAILHREILKPRYF